MKASTCQRLPGKLNCADCGFSLGERRVGAQRKRCSECGARHAKKMKRARDRHRGADLLRHAKQRAHGRGTSAWRRLREAALERDGYRCQIRVDAGCTGLATSVHLRPELNGDHLNASLADVVSACLHCHGVVDGRRSRHVA